MPTVIALSVIIVGLVITALFAASAVWFSMRARDFDAVYEALQTSSFDRSMAMYDEAKRRWHTPPWYVRLTGGTDR